MKLALLLAAALFAFGWAWFYVMDRGNVDKP